MPSTAPSVAPAANGLPAGAHMALHCPRIGDALFRSADVLSGSALGPPIAVGPPGGIDQAAPFVPVPLIMGAGTLLLRDGLLGAGYVAWRSQVAASAAPRHDCELDVDDGSGRFLTRYAIQSAQPVAIIPDPPRADGAVGALELSHTGIRLINF